MFLYIIINETTQEYEKRQYIYMKIWGKSTVNRIVFFSTRIGEHLQLNENTPVVKKKKNYV